MIALRGSFSNIRLYEQFYLRFNPQVYYLNMDQKDGWYFNGTLALVRRNFPISFSALISQAIQTEIPEKDDFLWNVSLIYTFSKEFIVR